MSKISYWVISVGVTVFLLVGVCSCDKGGDHHPSIYFQIKPDSVTYESTFVSLPRDTVFSLNLNASKSGLENLLRSVTIAKSVNGSADSLILQANIYTTFFNQYYAYQAGDSGDIERYTFKVTNDEGLSSSIQFVDTVR